MERRVVSVDPEEHDDPAAASVSLAAEAALLETRLLILQEALDTVDARIKAVSDALCRLRRSACAADGADHADHGSASGPDEAVSQWHDAWPE